jgi:hypothetical protein
MPRFARGSVGPQADWLAVAVRARFPKLVAALGDGLFEMVLAGFAEREPHAKSSLAAMHERLPDYLMCSPAFPLWYGELAALDRAHVRVLNTKVAVPLTRAQLTPDRELRVTAAHATVVLTTTADDLWSALDDAAATCTRARVPKPRALDWPRTVLVWRRIRGEIERRTIDPDEETALRAAARGTSLVELAAGLSHARALDLVLRWIDDGVLADQSST